MAKLSDTIQRTLKWAIPALIVFVVVYAIGKSNEPEVIYTENEDNEEAIVADLYERGYLSNAFAYGVALAAVRLGVDIDPGAYMLSKNMGPLAFLAAVTVPEYKYVRVIEGQRREEIAALFAEELGWTPEQQESFANILPMCTLSGGEGYMFPGTYVVHKNDTPEDVREKMRNRLNEVFQEMVNEGDAPILNVHQVLTIASLIQREAAGKGDMRLISGVIWNRLFQEMPLQIDATLQYIKANEEIGWWPMVRSEDKYLTSPYNTYENKGLPPGPIANPGKAAIEAALNPTDTTCLFYIHDRSRNIHCTSSYETHKRNISYYLQ